MLVAHRQSETESLRILIPEGSDANITPIATGFSQSTGVRTDISQVGIREIGTKLLTSRLMNRETFDVVVPPTYEIPDLVAAGALQTLDQLLPGDATNLREKAALYTLGDTFNGVRYGHQTDGDVFVMFLNRDILTDPNLRRQYEERFGVPLKPPQSWSELDRQIAFISEATGRPCAVFFRDRGQIEWEFWLRLHAKGLWPLSKSFDPQFDSPEGLEALSEMMAITPYILENLGNEGTFLNGWEKYLENSAYVTFGWGGTQKFFRLSQLARSGSILPAQIPGGEGPDTPDSLPYFNWGWSYAVSREATNPGLAHSFINYAISAEISTMAIREGSGYFDPFREEHYQDAAIRDIYGDEFLEVHKSSLSNAIPDLYIANRRAYFDTLGAWLTLAIDGTIDPAIALQKASDHWRLLADQREKQQQVMRWQRLRATYPPAVAARLRDIPRQT